MYKSFIYGYLIFFLLKIVEDVFPNHVNRMDSRNNMRGVDNVALDIQDSEYGYMEHFFDQVQYKI